jgi:hypothetical protein
VGAKKAALWRRSRAPCAVHTARSISHIHTYTHVHTYTYIQAHTYTHVHTYTHRHTQTHTHIQAREYKYTARHTAQGVRAPASHPGTGSTWPSCPSGAGRWRPPGPPTGPPSARWKTHVSSGTCARPAARGAHKGAAPSRRSAHSRSVTQRHSDQHDVSHACWQEGRGVESAVWVGGGVKGWGRGRGRVRHTEGCRGCRLTAASQPGMRPCR